MAGHDVPFIRKGVGHTPEEGGCIMQVISWIAEDGQWHDTPKCVFPLLRDAAIEVNDHASDEERQRLLDLAPRLINTRIDDPGQGGFVTATLQLRYNTLWNDLCLDAPHSSGSIGVDGLISMLDLYDEVTGRPKVTEPLDFSGVCAAMAGA